MTGYLAAFGLTLLAALFCGSCMSLLRRRRPRNVEESASSDAECSASQVLSFPPPPLGLSDTAMVDGLSLREAEDMLDWLEQNNYRDCNLLCQDDASFAVEFRLKDSADKAPVVKNPAVSLQRYSVG
jgi:hypothetical protein